MALVRIPSYDQRCLPHERGYWDSTAEQYVCLEVFDGGAQPPQPQTPEPQIDVTLGLGVVPVWIWGWAGGLVVLWLLGLGRR